VNKHRSEHAHEKKKNTEEREKQKENVFLKQEENPSKEDQRRQQPTSAENHNSQGPEDRDLRKWGAPARRCAWPQCFARRDPLPEKSG